MAAKVFEGILNAKGVRVGIVASRFNDMITNQLLSGAQAALRRHGAEQEADVAWVPGAFELGFAAKKLADSGNYDVILCLGAVIRGATAHFDHVAAQAAHGVAQASLQSGIPVIFGVLTTDTIEQAIERSGTKAGNKGYDTAVAAIEMAQLSSRLPNRKKGA